MRKVLYILGELKDTDIDWLVAVGSKESVSTSGVLVREGQPLDAMFLVLDGHFSVSIGNGKELARLGSGEIVGELSYLDSRPPNATVTATEDSTVLAVPRSRLTTKIKTDTAFASRFYRALGVFLADRLRSTVGQLAYGSQPALDESVESEDEISPDLLDTMDLAAARFQSILNRMRGA